jgi:hypothetical protein
MLGTDKMEVEVKDEPNPSPLVADIAGIEVAGYGRKGKRARVRGRTPGKAEINQLACDHI